MKNFLLASLFTFLFFLGSWQLYRMSIKSGIITRIEMHPVHIDSFSEIASKDLAYRKVIAIGIADDSAHFNVISSKNGPKHFIPFTFSKDDKTILVDESSHDKHTSESIGYVICSGNSILKILFKNDEKSNLWAFFDFERMSTIYGKTIHSCRIQAAKPTVYNHHLEYAITWYVLSFVIAVAAVVIHRKKQKN